MRSFSLAVLVLFALAGPAVAEGLQGQVVDGRTARPLDGAIVVGMWRAQQGSSVQEAETDAQGRFVLQEPADAVGGRPELVMVYKFGYIVWSNVETFLPGDRPPWYQPRADTSIPARIALDPFPSGVKRSPHLAYLGLVPTAERPGWRRFPRLRQAIQPEVEQALKEEAPEKRRP